MDCLNCLNMACAYRSKADQDDISRDKRFIFDGKDLQCSKYQPDSGTPEEIFKELDEIIIGMTKSRNKNG
jgi:hypothetical protein